MKFLEKDYKLPFKLALLLSAAVSASVLWQQGQLAVLALSRIDPVPETRQMVAAGHYAEAAGYLDFFMEYDYVNQDAAAQALHAQIAQEHGRAADQAGKAKEGLVDGTSNETIGQIVGVASERREHIPDSATALPVIYGHPEWPTGQRMLGLTWVGPGQTSATRPSRI